MERRAFLKQASAAGLAGATLAAPAMAADGAVVRWRMASSFPRSLDTIYGAGEQLCKRVGELSAGRFQIRCYPGGDIVPGTQVLDAVQNGTVECGHSCSHYYVGKNTAFSFDATLPFGLTSRQQNAWLYYGGGLPLLREFFAKYGMINFPGGNTGAQMGGWFRKEVKSLADLKGLRMRIPGLGGEVMSRLGVVTHNLPGGDIYSALEKGQIDASEWVGPYDDEKLGLYRIARHYYYPGFWEPGPTMSFYVAKKEWDKLPPEFKAAFEVACAEANLHMQAEYDAKNPAALVRLLEKGATLHPFPPDVMKAAQKAAFSLYEEEAGKNADFRKIYSEWKKFRTLQHSWSNLAENKLENFMYANRIR